MKKLAINPSNKKYYSDDYIKGWEDGVKAQYEATKDAVEVVRCENCKHRREDCGMGNHRWCDSLRMSTRADDFCSYGERREP